MLCWENLKRRGAILLPLSSNYGTYWTASYAGEDSSYQQKWSSVYTVGISVYTSYTSTVVGKTNISSNNSYNFRVANVRLVKDVKYKKTELDYIPKKN